MGPAPARQRGQASWLAGSQHAGKPGSMRPPLWVQIDACPGWSGAGAGLPVLSLTTTRKSQPASASASALVRSPEAITFVRPPWYFCRGAGDKRCSAPDPKVASARAFLGGAASAACGATAPSPNPVPCTAPHLDVAVNFLHQQQAWVDGICAIPRLGHGRHLAGGLQS